MNLKYRIAIILLLVAASGWTLWPRRVIERVKRNGVFVYDTVERVPLKRGLDLRGGMHLALEIDESRGTVADKSAALDNSLKVIRNRIDQFGVAEPVVQKVGNDRIIVELPGIDDPQRAQELVQKAAFLQFQITDKTSALDRTLPRLDGLLRVALVLQHDEQTVLCAVELALEAGVATKTHVLNILHRLIDGKAPPAQIGRAHV